MADEQAPKRRRGWIAALVVLLVLAVAGGLAAYRIRTDEEVQQSGPPKDDRISGQDLRGNGYAYALPDGWTDVTTDALQTNLPEGVDTVSGRGVSFRSSTATIIIERFEVKAGTSTADVQKSWERNLTRERGLRATYVPSLDIDGEPALGRQIRRALVGGDAILQVAYLVIHEGYGYSIGLNSQEGDSDAGAAFDGVVSSWIWVD